MQTPFTSVSRLKTLCVLGTIALCAASAHAGNGGASFDDGLKNQWDKPHASIYVDRHEGRGWGRVEHDWRFDFKHHGWKGWGGWGEHGGGNGGIGGVSPIPEPATDAMLLGGLAVLATFVRRRSSSRR